MGRLTDAGRVAGRYPAHLFEGGLLPPKTLDIGVAFHMLIDGKGYAAVFGTNLHGHNLIDETPFLDSAVGTLLALQRQFILHLSRDPEPFVDILGRNAHSDPFEAIVQEASHIVRRFDVSERRAPTLRGKEVGRSAHRLSAGANRNLRVAERNDLRGRDNRLKA